ncbi:MAG: zinc-finger-containing protein [Geminicoccaceae bacterium]
MIATCLHCGGDCRLTDGAEIYPHRPDLADKQIWKCDACKARVGCHPDTTDPLGQKPCEPETSS